MADNNFSSGFKGFEDEQDLLCLSTTQEFENCVGFEDKRMNRIDLAEFSARCESEIIEN
jgi:hypothetical protein